MPPQNDLKEQLLKNNGNFAEVGRSYNVSDNVVRSWCKQYNMSYHSKDYKQSESRNNSDKHKIFPVQQIDPYTKEVVATFQSASEARRITGIAHILDVCNGHRKSAGGFDWKQLKN